MAEKTKDQIFADTFSDYVNGSMRSPKEVAKLMANDHRHLIQEKFKVCLEYIKVLAENYQKGYYDPRNEWACQTSDKIVKAMEKEHWYI